MRTILLSLFFLAVSVLAAPPSRGYLDADYPVKTLNGKNIYILGLSRSNAVVEGLVDSKGAAKVDSAVSDSLLTRFNQELSTWFTQKLSKAVLKLEAGPVSAGTMLSRTYGDSVVPDSIRILIPNEEYFRKQGIKADVSLLIGRTVFGKRSILVQKWTGGPPGSGPAGSAFHPGMNNPFPHHFAGSAGTWTFDKDDGEIDTSVTKSKRKVFYSITEFCFFDHRTGKPFGYGIDVAETKFYGELLGFLAGGKVNARAHMSKMAMSLINVFLRADSDKVKKYSSKELESIRVVFEKDDTKEVLEPDEEE